MHTCCTWHIWWKFWACLSLLQEVTTRAWIVAMNADKKPPKPRTETRVQPVAGEDQTDSPRCHCQWTSLRCQQPSHCNHHESSQLFMAHHATSRRTSLNRLNMWQHTTSKTIKQRCIMYTSPEKCSLAQDFKTTSPRLCSGTPSTAASFARSLAPSKKLESKWYCKQNFNIRTRVWPYL